MGNENGGLCKKVSGVSKAPMGEDGKMGNFWGRGGAVWPGVVVGQIAPTHKRSQRLDPEQPNGGKRTKQKKEQGGSFGKLREGTNDKPRSNSTNQIFVKPGKMSTKERARQKGGPHWGDLDHNLVSKAKAFADKGAKRNGPPTPHGKQAALPGSRPKAWSLGKNFG